MCISELQNIFNERFLNFRLQKQNINFITQPFSAVAEDAAAEL